MTPPEFNYLYHWCTTYFNHRPLRYGWLGIVTQKAFKTKYTVFNALIPLVTKDSTIHLEVQEPSLPHGPQAVNHWDVSTSQFWPTVVSKHNKVQLLQRWLRLFRRYSIQHIYIPPISHWTWNKSLILDMIKNLLSIDKHRKACMTIQFCKTDNFYTVNSMKGTNFYVGIIFHHEDMHDSAIL